jgi:hypothetical protein
MKRYTFIIKLKDHQASTPQYYKVRKYGDSWEQAQFKAKIYMKFKFHNVAYQDYNFTLLTLNEFNALQKQ